MEGRYDVFLGDKKVGTVTLQREGLYYRCTCRCSLDGDVICRLTAFCGDKQERLGVLMPMGDGFGLDAKIAARRLGQGKPVFRIEPNRVVIPGQFVPLSPQEPFKYLTRLKQAYLERRDGQVGIVINNEGRI